MLKRTDISKARVDSSDPIIIGQSAKLRIWKTMKLASMAVFLFTTTAYAVNVSPEIPLCVNDLQGKRSSGLVQITVQASPLNGTKIDFYSFKLNSQSEVDASSFTFLFSLNTDEKGRIETPELSPGRYCVSARGDNQFAQLLINVVPGKRARTTRFTMYLVAPPSSSPPHPQWTPADEQIPIQKRVPVFRGIVTDVSGAVIPTALIDIITKGTEGKKHVAQLKAGSDGRFSAKLKPGLYIGFFYADGFKDKVVPFEITKEGTGDIDVVLEIPNPSLNITRLDLPNNAQTN